MYRTLAKSAKKQKKCSIKLLPNFWRSSFHRIFLYLHCTIHHQELFSDLIYFWNSSSRQNLIRICVQLVVFSKVIVQSSRYFPKSAPCTNDQLVRGKFTVAQKSSITFSVMRRAKQKLCDDCLFVDIVEVFTSRNCALVSCARPFLLPMRSKFRHVWQKEKNEGMN